MVIECPTCKGEGQIEKNIYRGQEGMQIEMDVMVVCSECDGEGSVNDINEDEDVCQACGGTGEGQYSDSRCNTCKGKGY